MYYQVSDTPKPIVFQFKRACESSKFEELDLFFQKEEKGIFSFLKPKQSFIENKIRKEEYPYAFWYGLYGSLKGDNEEGLNFILNHKDLKCFMAKSKIKKVLFQYKYFVGIPREKYPSMYDETDYIIPQTPIRHPIDITKPFKIAAEKGNFDLFFKLKNTEIGNHINWESLLMSAFKFLNQEIFEKLIQINNIDKIVDKYLELICEYIIETKNEFSINVLKDYFKINLNEDRLVFMDNYEKDKQFADYLKLNLMIKRSPNIVGSVVKV